MSKYIAPFLFMSQIWIDMQRYSKCLVTMKLKEEKKKKRAIEVSILIFLPIVSRNLPAYLLCEKNKFLFI